MVKASVQVLPAMFSRIEGSGSQYVIPSSYNISKNLRKKYSQTENQDEKIKQLIEESKTAIKKLKTKKLMKRPRKQYIAGTGKTLASTITMIAAAVDGDWYAFTQNGLDVIP